MEEVKIGGQVVSKDIADAVEAGNAALTAKNFKDAVASYEKASAALPAFMPIRFALARAYYGAGDLKKAVATMGDVYTADPANARNAMLYANMLLEDGQLDKGKAIVDKLPADAVDATALTNIGIVLMNKKQPAAARDYFTKVIDVESEGCRRLLLPRPGHDPGRQGEGSEGRSPESDRARSRQRSGERSEGVFEVDQVGLRGISRGTAQGHSCPPVRLLNARGIVFALHVRPLLFQSNGDPPRRGSSRRLSWLAQSESTATRRSSSSPSTRCAPIICRRTATRRSQTPAIDRFRADSILFEHAYSHCPLTLVSHASVFTGLLPADHGIRDNLGYDLNPKAKTLAELLKSKGYATGGAVSAVVLRGETGIKRGFDFWEDSIDIDPSFLSIGRAQRSGEATRALAQKWIGEHDHDAQPFFFFFHIYEPHTPYEPPEPFRSRYASAYDGEVATADDVVGKFLDYLRAEGIYDRATILLMSDHGEGLGDHGEDEHGVLLYRETLQVPLMLKLPKARAQGNERRRAGAAHRRLPDHRIRIRTDAESRRPIAARYRCEAGGGSPDLLRDVLPAAALRLERHALAHLRREALHPRRRSGALRPRRRSRRNAQRAARRPPHVRRAARADQAVHQIRGHAFRRRR